MREQFFRILPHRHTFLPVMFCLFVLSTLICLSGEASAQSKLPRPDHVVIIIEENHAFSQILGPNATSSAPYMNALAKEGVSFTNFYALHHPSQPNYLELFAGSTLKVSSNSCPKNLFSEPSLGGELIKAGLSFRGYAEDLPHVGATDSVYKEGGANYARKHCPWVNFTDVKPEFSLPFSQFPSDFNSLPTVAFIIPNQNNDMHDGSIKVADEWLREHLDAYVRWAKTHNSLLIVTWDEDDGRENNQIPTIIVGAGIKSGEYAERTTHHDLLRTIEEMYGLPLLGKSQQAVSLSDIWQPSTAEIRAKTDAGG